ncbi:pyruvate kinase [Candidatus Sumerlaeota bacterium]|nr:pyruvate kinase [Candidatus Sumerlaeota bacterium]
MARTKIVATLGPATTSPAIIRELIDAGTDVFRLNFSYGTYEEHHRFIQWIRRVSQQKKCHCAIIADLCGPKIRCGVLESEPLLLSPGENVVLVPAGGKRRRRNKVIPITYPRLAKDVRPGDRIMLADGEMELRVKQVKAEGVICEVRSGGFLSSHKGVNFPDTKLRVSALTEKDKQDVRFCLTQGVDFFALSFVREAKDIVLLRNFIKQSTNGRLSVPIIAKIEKAEALSHINEIIAEAQGIMVARGDLGVEIPLYEVPLAQKQIIQQANDKGKPVITATQMLESMLARARPTRAEVTDIANAILDGSDALMLSGETAEGKFPVQAVKIMNQVAEATEKSIDYRQLLSKKCITEANSIPDAISHATCVIADDLGLDAILCLTISGMTARMVARYRPRAPVLGCSPSSDTLRQLALSWGVVPVKIPPISVRTSFERAIERAVNIALRKRLIRKGDRVVITAGLPLLRPGTTDILRVISI